MIITCPACQTRYLVDDAGLGADTARRVRCASCGNLWRFAPEKVPIPAAVPEGTAGAGPDPAVPASRGAASGDAVSPPVVPQLRAEPGARLSFYPEGSVAQGRPSVAAKKPTRGRRLSLMLAIGAIIILAVAFVVMAFLALGALR